jgi:Na+/glutamate symporter
MLILVLVFGNQAYAEWADKHAQGQSVWQLFLRTLAWPRWSLTQGSSTARDLIVMDLRPLLLIVFVAALIGLTHHSATDWIGGLVVGWFTVILGSGIAALLTAFLTTGATAYGALLAALQAAGYGLVVGWIVGIVLARVRRSAAAAS